MGARKATKSKDPGRSPSVAGKNTTSAGKNVQPGSAKGGKAGKVGPAEKLKLEEENLARVQQAAAISMLLIFNLSSLF